MTLKKLITVLVFAVSIAALGSGCSGDQDKAPPTTTAPLPDGVKPLAYGGKVSTGTGEGTVRVERPDGKSKPAVFRVTSDGENLSRITVKAKGAGGATLIDAFGGMDGTYAVLDPKVTELLVTTTSSWTVQFFPAAKLPEFELGPLEGAGAQAYRSAVELPYIEAQFRPDTSSVFSASAPFSLISDGEQRSTGKAQGPSTVLIKSGEPDSLILVAGDGPWTIRAAARPSTESTGRPRTAR